MTPRRIAVKFEVTPDPEAQVDVESAIGIFHRFIQQKRVEGLLIDVADYTHVPKGPGVMLIGHDVDYAIDSTGGRTGLLTVRKRIESKSIEEVMVETLRWAVVAMQAIEEDAATGLQFATQRVNLQLVDRLAAPNTDAGFAAYKADLEALATRLYGENVREVRRVGASEARRPLCAEIVANEAVAYDVLLDRLSG